MAPVLKFTIGGLFCFLLISGPVSGQNLPDTLYVKSLVLTTGIVDNEPVDTVQAFAVSVDKKAYCHVRIFNGLGTITITVQWFHNGQLYLNRPVTITNSTGFRVYTSIHPEAGKWEVRVLGPNQKVLARKRFSILASSVQSVR